MEIVVGGSQAHRSQPRIHYRHIFPESESKGSDYEVYVNLSGIASVYQNNSSLSHMNGIGLYVRHWRNIAFHQTLV